MTANAFSTHDIQKKKLFIILPKCKQKFCKIYRTPTFWRFTTIEKKNINIFRKENRTRMQINIS